MSVEDTAGVAALARILRELGQGEAPGVTALAARSGVSRTTAFEIVRRLATAGLVRRDMDGVISAGPSAVALGFAAFGIAPLAGPAETLLNWLHERSDAFIDLAADQTALITLGKPQPEISLDAAVRDADGREKARLRLAWRPNTAQAERARIVADFERVRISLESYLD